MTSEPIKSANVGRLHVALVQIRTAFLFAIFLLALCLLWFSYSERRGEARAAEFCAGTKIGDNEQKIKGRLAQAGPKEQAQRHEDSDGVVWALTFFGPLKSRHICLLKLKSDAVVKIETRFMD